MNQKHRFTALALAAALCASVLSTGCSSTGAKPDTAALVSVSVTYATAKIAAKKPQYIPALDETAGALDVLAAGVVNAETVTTILQRHLPLGDSETRALAGIIAAYFPPPDAAIPIPEKVSALARTVAAAIRLGLPPSK